MKKEIYSNMSKENYKLIILTILAILMKEIYSNQQRKL